VALNDDGDAVAVADATARPLRVPFGVPGDALRVNIWEKDASSRHQHSPMYAELLDVVTPSAHRIATPPCAKFFGVCGGCKHQNVAYAQQLEQKQQRVETVLKAIEMREPVRRIRGVETDQGLYAYRNKMEFTCSTGRWRLASEVAADEESAAPATFTLGLFPVASVGTRRARHQKKRVQWNPRLLSIDSCAVQDAACNTLLELTRSLCEELGIEAYDFHSNDGFLKHLVLQRGIVGGKRELMVGFVTTTMDGDQQRLLEQLVAQLFADRSDGELVSIMQRVDDEALRHRVSKGELTPEDVAAMPKERTLHGRAFFQNSILDHTFQVSLDSFFQPNSTQASILYSVVRNELALMSLKTKPIVWDLFCGVGSIGICMGPHVHRLVGIELVEAAVERARVNATLNGYGDKMEFHHLDLSTQWSEITDRLEQLSRDAATRPDVVIVDPPRAGLHKKLISLLRSLAPPRICYVSCNPQTQARDLAMLTENGRDGVSAYVVDFVQPVDMLPHTPHTETVAWLTRRDLSLP
jgi:23S rRNA (uracil1939-C5)-methyltransferase